MKAKEEKIDVKKMYGWASLAKPEELYHKYQTSPFGLTETKVKQNQATYGKNQMKQKRAKKWYHYLLESLLTPFNMILLGIMLVLFYTDVILPEEPSYANVVVILTLILVSTILEFFEVYKSNRAAEKLKQMVATSARVIRGGEEIDVPMEDIVVGDLIVLTAGSIIPADLRMIETKDLYLTQASLTGESDAVQKVEVSKKTEEELENITDFDTICFTGTNVTNGYGKGIVICVGENTYFGKVANTIVEGKPKTAFQKGVENISKLLIRFMLYMIPITFLINIWKHGDVITVFSFSVAIAIGITPLLLPVILSSSLAKGAVRMSKKKTIIKRLESIQSFGAMNILCTDKTGTLTEDKIVLEKYLDIKGEEDKRVLKQAFLNAYFQTGLKGNIDEAVIARTAKTELKGIEEKYEKIDEIPFDFSRRRLSVIVSDGKEKQLITKGAVEEILSICTKVDYKGEISEITRDIKQNILNITKELNKQGLRVVAVAQKSDIENIKSFSVKDESKMVLIGFIGFLDPPKESAKDEIARLNKDGIRVIVLTGDNEYVTKAICDKVGINSDKIILGSKIDKLSDTALKRQLKKTNVYAKLSPIQKARIVRILKEAKNVVGYMGDGINDAPSMHNAEVGISVDTAVDITKETADIILLEKDLGVLTDGVIEGRKTFGNLQKYIKMAVSFNFGEVLSVLIASVLLPFFPITPIQLLVQSLLYDLGQLSIPYDNVDKEYLTKPRKWNMKSIKRFMLHMGPASSVFDLMVFAILWFGFGLRLPDAVLFQSIWFSYGVVSNLIGLHVIRTAKTPFIESHSSKAVYATSIGLSIVAILIPFTFIGKYIGLVPIPLKYFSIILLVPVLYCFLATIVKKEYIKKYKEWL